MRMDEIGYNHRHDESFYIERPDGTGDWLLLVIKTRCIFQINDTKLHVPANSFIIYTPEFPQYYSADHTEYIDDWIHFGPDEEELALMHELNIPLNRVVTLSDISHISAIVRNMCYEQYSANRMRKASVDLYFRLLLYKLSESMDRSLTGKSVSEGLYFEQLLWLRESIYRWPSRDWGIDDMAAEMSLSRSRLQHLYSDTFGVSISKDLAVSRMDKACDLLRNTDMPMAKIASLSGYGSASYFIRQFKAAFQMTPVQYRAKFLEKDSTGENENDKNKM